MQRIALTCSEKVCTTHLYNGVLRTRMYVQVMSRVREVHCLSGYIFNEHTESHDASNID